MKNYKKYILKETTSIIEVLQLLEKVESGQTLFIENNAGNLIGTITDGDFRRGILKGLNINNSAIDFCNTKFKYITEQIDVKYLKLLREDGIKVVPQINKKGKIINILNLNTRKSLLPIHAIIMAGGRGERLRPLTDKVPKPMLLIKNKPIIEHNIDHLISFGVESITISLGYLGDQIMSYFGNGTSKGITIDYINETKPMGTIGCLSLKKEFKFEQILLMNSDLFTNIDLENFYLQFVNEDADMCVATIPYSVDIPYAILGLERNRIINFVEKPRNTHYANAGLYLFKKEFINIIPKDKFYNATDLMQKLIDEKKRIIHCPITGYWIDIGKHDDYLKAIEIIKHIKE